MPRDVSQQIYSLHNKERAEEAKQRLEESIGDALERWERRGRRVSKYGEDS